MPPPSPPTVAPRPFQPFTCLSAEAPASHRSDLAQLTQRSFRPLPAFELVPPGALRITRVPTHKGSGSSAVTSLPVLWPLGTLVLVSSLAGDPARPRGSDGLFR